MSDGRPSQEEINTTNLNEDWRNNFIDYLHNNMMSEDKKVAR